LIPNSLFPTINSRRRLVKTVVKELKVCAMAKKKNALRGHTGSTAGGHTKYVKVERIGSVTIYKRGDTYSLYYRENGRTIRSNIDGNLAAARSSASKVNGQLEDGQRSMFSFRKITPGKFAEGYIDYVRDVQRLAWRTVERYRAALDRFVDFAEGDGDVSTIDQVNEATVQDFIRWLRGLRRARNGSAGGTRENYRASGIRFILSTCRTAFNWARRRRLLPPYADNSFAEFPIKRVRDRDEQDRNGVMLAAKEWTRFMEACDEWQQPVFRVIAAYGLRVAELTHLTIGDIDFDRGIIRIRPKPELMWFVKTNRERDLAITVEVGQALRKVIGKRRGGFVFLARPFVSGDVALPLKAKSPTQSQDWFERHLMEVQQAGTSDAKLLARHMERVARTVGKISEKKVRQEFMAVTKAIGRPGVTKVHSLRHLFSTRAQEAGMSPLMVQQILGHTTLQMTARYTHLGIEAQRKALGEVGKTTDG